MDSRQWSVSRIQKISFQGHSSFMVTYQNNGGCERSGDFHNPMRVLQCGLRDGVSFPKKYIASHSASSRQPPLHLAYLGIDLTSTANESATLSDIIYLNSRLAKRGCRSKRKLN